MLSWVSAGVVSSKDTYANAIREKSFSCIADRESDCPVDAPTHPYKGIAEQAANVEFITALNECHSTS
eukprot:m.570570 g.570570  ORF g.570570 m.570570 type:complete len:68 (-) comp22263_c3_seq37:119-322(-)